MSSIQLSPPVTILDLDEENHIRIIQQHNFYNILQNPLCAMVCTAFADLFRRCRAEGRMMLPHAVKEDSDVDSVITAHSNAAHWLEDCPEDGVVALLAKDCEGVSCTHGPVGFPHSPSPKHCYIIGVGKEKPRVESSVLSGSITCIGLCFLGVGGKSNAVAIVPTLMPNGIAHVTLKHCEATKGQNGIIIDASCSLIDVTMRYNAHSGLCLMGEIMDSLFVDCVIKSNAINAIVTNPGGTWEKLGTKPPRFKNCIIGGSPLQNFQVTPYL